MTAVVLWKEYRQQRAFWLAIVFLALLLVISLSATLGRGSGLQVFKQEPLRETLLIVVSALVLTYCVVSGALLLAGENDDSTVFYLDTLAGRNQLWLRKCLAGLLLTMALSLMLSALSLGLGLVSRSSALLLLLQAMEAFAWGMLAGALCRRVLNAVMTGIGFLLGSWIVFMVFGQVYLPILVGEGAYLFGVAKLGATVAAGYLSWRLYTEVDRSRQPESTRLPAPRFSVLPTSVRVLLWLILRQGRSHLIVCVVLTIVVTLSANIVFWPIGTLVLGLICGLATFMDDQNDGTRFLTAQRFPVGKIWLIKIGFWGLTLFVLITLAWFANMASFRARLSEYGTLQVDQTYLELFQRWIGMGRRGTLLSPLIFLGMWPLYGFCLGQYCTQVIPRPVVAGFLAVFLAPLVAIWIPSYLLGGLALWQVLVVPVLMLLLTRINQRSWLSGRLLVGKPFVVLVAGTVLVMLGQAGTLWYRVVEIPDVGEPFDVRAFEASLPTPEQNEAGRLMRRAGEKMHELLKANPPPDPEWRLGVGKELSELVQERLGLNLDEKLGDADGPMGMPAETAKWIRNSNEFLSEILAHGWHSRGSEKTASWLDRLFAGTWAPDAETVARLPLGMIADPRRIDSANLTIVYEDCRLVVKLFAVRAVQLQVQGDARAALKNLETALGLIRQMKNYAITIPFLRAGLHLESKVLTVYRTWLQNVPKDKALLRDALAILQHHEATNPTAENAIKSNYLYLINNDPVLHIGDPIFPGSALLLKGLINVSVQVPWEKARLHRLTRVFVAGQLRASKHPLWENPGQRENERRHEEWRHRHTIAVEAGDLGAEDRFLRGNPYPPRLYTESDKPDIAKALLLDLPPKNGPGSSLGVEVWANLLFEFELNWPSAAFWIPLEQVPANTLLLHTAELATALALYQVDHGTPKSIEVVVPEYLAALLDDPYSGEPIYYRISRGEEITSADSPPITLVPGQGVVVGLLPGAYFPLPYWEK